MGASASSTIPTAGSASHANPTGVPPTFDPSTPPPGFVQGIPPTAQRSNMQQHRRNVFGPRGRFEEQQPQQPGTSCKIKICKYRLIT